MPPHAGEIEIEQDDIRAGGGLGFLVGVFAMVNQKVEPSPGTDSTPIWPPWDSTIFLTMVSPAPVPGYSSRVCKRLKISKIRPTCSGAIPMPLSDTVKR